MPGNFGSAEVTAGSQATADQYNGLRDDVLKNAGDYATAGGSANAFTLTLSSDLPTLAAGRVIKFLANHTVTGASTVAVTGASAEGAKDLKKFKSGAIAAIESGDIQNGAIIVAVYDGTQYIVVGGLQPGGIVPLTAAAGYDVTAKVWQQNFDLSDAYDFTLTAGAPGVCTNPATDSLGYVHQAVTATGGCSTEFYTKNKFQAGTFATIIVEYLIKIIVVPSTDKVNYGLGANATAGQYPGFENNSFALAFDGTNWVFKTLNGATVESDTISAPSTGWHRVRFEITGNGTTYKCFIDNVQVGTTHTTQIPVTTTQQSARSLFGTLASNTIAAEVDCHQVRIVMVP